MAIIWLAGAGECFGAGGKHCRHHHHTTTSAAVVVTVELDTWYIENRRCWRLRSLEEDGVALLYRAMQSEFVRSHSEGQPQPTIMLLYWDQAADYRPSFTLCWTEPAVPHQSPAEWSADMYTCIWVLAADMLNSSELNNTTYVLDSLSKSNCFPPQFWATQSKLFLLPTVIGVLQQYSTDHASYFTSYVHHNGYFEKTLWQHSSPGSFGRSNLRPSCRVDSLCMWMHLSKWDWRLESESEYVIPTNFSVLCD